MPQLQSDQAALTPFERPACPNCNAIMLLKHIEPAKQDHDKRTFACPRCGSAKSVLVQFR